MFYLKGNRGRVNGKKSSIKVNFIYNIVYQILLIIIPLITSPYISRILGSEGVGTYAYAFSIANTAGSDIKLYSHLCSKCFT